MTKDTEMRATCGIYSARSKQHDLICEFVKQKVQELLESHQRPSKIVQSEVLYKGSGYGQHRTSVPKSQWWIV